LLLCGNVISGHKYYMITDINVFIYINIKLTQWAQLLELSVMWIGLKWFREGLMSYFVKRLGPFSFGFIRHGII
jgi:hypothetical protein